MEYPVMPAKSESQRRMLNARFGHDWVRRHHFDNRGKLPERVGGKSKKKKGKAMKHDNPYRSKMMCVGCHLKSKIGGGKKAKKKGGGKRSGRKAY